MNKKNGKTREEEKKIKTDQTKRFVQSKEIISPLITDRVTKILRGKRKSRN